ncbi:MAG: cytochrome c, partial [Deltaproteobacteria bacterium]|nr:cytochrome c [Deltaproteobacteria bacterium]
LGIEGCADAGGMFDDGVMCVDVAQCNVPPLNGEMLYIDTCQFCHGVDGVGIEGVAPPVVGATTQDIIDANMEMGLSLPEVEAVADFLGGL